MGISCRIVVAALTLAVLAAPIAAAHGPQKDGGAFIAPARGGGLTGGELLGEDWAQGLARPFSSDPLSGSCRTLVRNVLIPAYGPDGTATCTATKHTRLFIFFGTAYTSLDDPFPQTEEDQLAAAVAADQAIHALTVTVDGRATNIRRRRFELFSPQRTVQLPADNYYGVPAGTTLTFTAHAWGAVIRKLRPGQHTVTMEVVAPDFGGTFTFTINLNIVRGGGPSDDDDD